jgi:hypothetical protein
MREHRITIDIDGDGKITADAEGFTGDACLRDLEALLADLATPPAEIVRKAAGGPSAAARAATKLTTGRKP